MFTPKQHRKEVMQLFKMLYGSDSRVCLDLMLMVNQTRTRQRRNLSLIFPQRWLSCLTALTIIFMGKLGQ